jgi:hypothetical protein
MIRAALFATAVLSLTAPAAFAEPAAAGPAKPTLLSASDAYFQMRVADAEQGFRAVLDDPQTPDLDLGPAARGLARIAWLIDRDAPAAEATLERGRAKSAGPELCRIATMAVRVLREAEQPQAALDLAMARTPDCAGTVQRDGFLVEQGRAALALATDGPQDGRAAALAAADQAIAGFTATGTLAPAAAKLGLGVALELSDPTAALRAWKDFYWLTDANAPASFKIADAEVSRLFAAALAPSPALPDQIAFERLLIRGGFYAEAKAYDREHGVAAAAGAASAYVPVAAYFDFRNRFDAATLAYDRKHARGTDAGIGYLGEALQIAAQASAKLGAGSPVTVLAEAYGLHWTAGDTAGVPSVHIGHVVEDTHYEVVQYGRRGSVRFLSIDNLASNGYQSWLWDGLASTGGWSEPETIVQVRSAYTSAPLTVLASLTPEAAAKAAEELPPLEAKDRDALATKRVAFLPGLQARLRREAQEAVAAKARAAAAQSGEPFERLFLKTYGELQLTHSIYIHEGRHVLDHDEFDHPFGLNSPELEYRAELSELEFAEFPKMPLITILSDVESATPHGVANRRIMEGLVAWIAAHPAAVAGYDPAVPPAEQIDRLSDAQIADIARGLDPYFKEHPDWARAQPAAAPAL